MCGARVLRGAGRGLVATLVAVAVRRREIAGAPARGSRPYDEAPPSPGAPSMTTPPPSRRALVGGALAASRRRRHGDRRPGVRRRRQARRTAAAQQAPTGTW